MPSKFGRKRAFPVLLEHAAQVVSADADWNKETSEVYIDTDANCVFKMAAPIENGTMVRIHVDCDGYTHTNSVSVKDSANSDSVIATMNVHGESILVMWLNSSWKLLARETDVDPGVVEDEGAKTMSMTGSTDATSAGSTFGNAAELDVASKKGVYVVESAGSSSGLKLKNGAPGLSFLIVNKSDDAMKLYPESNSGSGYNKINGESQGDAVDFKENTLARVLYINDGSDDRIFVMNHDGA